MQSLRQGMALMARDPAQARRLVGYGLGQEQMDRLRSSLQRLQSAEQERLSRYNARASRTALLDAGFDWAGGAVAITTILIALALLQAESRSRARAEQAVQHAAAAWNPRCWQEPTSSPPPMPDCSDQARELATVNREFDAFTGQRLARPARAPAA